MKNLPEYKCAEKFFDFFAEISRIPRGSGNTKAIADYLSDFAKRRGLEYIRDNADNVVIKKSATEGYESRPAIIFQGHTDMVLQSASGDISEIREKGVKIISEGGFLHADGTTLGADDGVAVAYALAVLDSSDIPHPAFEAVFTSDEEIGLLGACALDSKSINGRMMINIDSDAEGIFTAGCAGGRRMDITLPIDRKVKAGNRYALTIDGLRGGHSGIEIDKGRTNAVKRLAEYLSAIEDIRLISLTGGVADNAIPASASAEFISDKSMSEMNDIIDSIRAKAPLNAEKENVTLARSGKETPCPSLEDTNKLLSLIGELPSGVIKMSKEVAGQVETSLNLGVAKLDDSEASLTFSIRSAKGAEKEKLAKRLLDIAKKHGARVSEHGDYPAWEYRCNSPLRDTMCRIYREMYGKDAEVVTIHAGLECGIFSDKLEGLDCISIGPDAYDIHTPDERLSVSSAVRVWQYLLEILKNI